MAMLSRLESLHPVLRHVVIAVCGTIFIVTFFGLIPVWVAALTTELGWPRWNTRVGQAMGATLFFMSLALVIYCSRLFAVIGRGTPMPLAPPSELVVSGLYRFTLNPIYVAQVAIMLSYFLYFGELGLLLYTGIWLLLVQGFIVCVEEPDLRKRFGTPYIEYTRDVPRWVGIPARRRERAE